MMKNIPIICSESSLQQRVEHSLSPSVSCGLYSLLGFSGVMLHLLAKTIGYNDGFLTVLISALLI